MTLAFATACGSATLDATERATETEAPGDVYPTFQVVERFLVDPCGERVVLRGVNEMVVWTADQDGLPEYQEIAQTGANAVRVVWSIDASPEALDAAIANAHAAGLVPMVELHDGQGDFSMLTRLVDYWVRPEVIRIASAHQRYLLVSIGSGVGAAVDAATWENGYREALSRMRSAGIRSPIVIDAPGYGNDIDRLQASGPSVSASDPLGNVLFGVTMWANAGDPSWIHEEFMETVNLGLPLVLGEFSAYSVNDCPAQPFDYRSLMAEAQAMQVGWFAWSWGAVTNDNCPGYLDMTVDGTYAGLRGWGIEVATTDPNGIANTSVRPPSMLGETCP